MALQDWVSACRDVPHGPSRCGPIFERGMSKVIYTGASNVSSPTPRSPAGRGVWSPGSLHLTPIEGKDPPGPPPLDRTPVSTDNATFRVPPTRDRYNHFSCRGRCGGGPGDPPVQAVVMIGSNFQASTYHRFRLCINNTNPSTRIIMSAEIRTRLPPVTRGPGSPSSPVSTCTTTVLLALLLPSSTTVTVIS
jgi:hypothetical protein